MNLAGLDVLIVVVYLAAIIAIGFYVKRKSASGLESYFLGSRQLPWWMLAMSGSSSYFDITGTMWIVSLLVMVGLKGMWIQFMWGFIIAAFYMAFMGKWIRRSGVITGAEWMVKRFGPGRQGDLARLSYTIYAILTISALLGYTAVGMGKFGAEFIPLPIDDAILKEHCCAALIIGITGLYVVVGGFRGLTLVEFFQTIILTLGAIMVAYLGFAAFRTTNMAAPPPADWYSLWPTWTLDRNVPAGSVYDVKGSMYYMFGAIVMTYVAKGLLLCASGPEQLYDFQKFLAVRNPREASLTGMLWGVFHMVRFPMAMGIAVMGIVGFAAEPQLLMKIKTDPERVLPVVIAHALPAGLRGLALAALISAFMGTFSATVNGGASYLVRDVYQRYFRPRASDRELVYASYAASILFILMGIAISLRAKSINTMFTWIMATLGAGVLMPNVLRWYWSRFNGWGYFAGTATGMALSLLQAILESNKLIDQPVYVTFPILALSVMVVAIIVSLLTPPTDDQTLKRFYRDVQPAGAWGRIAKLVHAEDPTFRKEPFAIDLLNVCLAVPWLASLYTAPILLVTHQMVAAAIVGAVVLILSIVLCFTWWRHLPQAEQEAPQAPELEKAAI
ncbi:MAG: sodium:solute symporter family transporter [Bacillota bacterium]